MKTSTMTTISASCVRRGIDWPNAFLPTLYENNPPSDAQPSRYLSLHILNNNMDNKNIDEIKTSQKQQVTVPKDHHELITVMRCTTPSLPSYSATKAHSQLRSAVPSHRSKPKYPPSKVRIASDYTYPAKIQNYCRPRRFAATTTIHPPSSFHERGPSRRIA